MIWIWRCIRIPIIEIPSVAIGTNTCIIERKKIVVKAI